MGKMEVEPSQSLMPSRSTREPSQVCVGGSSHTVQQGFHPQSPQNQLRSLLGTRRWRKEVLHLVFWEHHMAGKGWEMARCSQISDHKARPPTVGLSREEGNPENYQHCFPVDNFQSGTGRMTLYLSSGSFNMPHGFCTKGGGKQVKYSVEWSATPPIAHQEGVLAID